MSLEKNLMVHVCENEDKIYELLKDINQHVFLSEIMLNRVGGNRRVTQ